MRVADGKKCHIVLFVALRCPKLKGFCISQDRGSFSGRVCRQKRSAAKHLKISRCIYGKKYV